MRKTQIIYPKGGVDMTYIDFIKNLLDNYDVGKPIYSSDIACILAEQFDISKEKAGAAIAVNMKRIIEKNIKPNLRFYRKGIYYLTDITPFGEVCINTEQLILDKYLCDNQGYEGELTFFYRIGLTTQIPRNRELVTNQAKNCVRYDERLDITIRPPKTKITAENRLYLQLLDALENMERVPIDNTQPYQTMAAYIKKIGLRYEVLLALADRYYNKGILRHLARTASEGGSI